MIIIDGVGDRPLKKLGDKTPLESAKTPNLDKIAKEGINGIMDPISPGIRPGSDTAHLSLLGYNPRDKYTGRGIYEAAGAGINVKEGDVGFRVNYATKEKGKIVDRRANRIKETKEIAKSIKEINKIEDVELIFRDSTAHRAALVLRGNGLSDKITSSDPKKPNKEPKKIKAKTKKAQKTARILNKFLEKVETELKNHPKNTERIDQGKLPVNTLLIRGAGKKPKIDSFNEKYGIEGAIVSATGLIEGIGKILEMEVIKPDEATGGINSNLINKAKSTNEAIKSNKFVLMHIKGTDVASHDGDYQQKINFLEKKVDPAIKKVIEKNKNKALITLTGDHSSPIEIKDHSADPVPLSIMGKGTRKDDVKEFTEKTYKGGLHRIKGNSLLPIMLDLIDRTKKFGA